jgi:probable poly-beta-1,6-N-acetyl-D-glucosamine export protein
MVRRLLYLNGLAVIAVILFHASGMGFVAMFSWTDRYLPGPGPNFDQAGSAAYYALRAVEGVVVFSIPAFLFISGFFMAFAAGRSQKTVSWDYVFNRIKYLLAPYLIWSLVTLILLYAQGIRYSLQELIINIATGQINPVFYYVPLLIQFYLLSPFLVAFARRNWKALLFVVTLIQLIVIAVQYPLFLGWDNPFFTQLLFLFPKWFFPARLFWFALGIIIGFNINQFKAVSNYLKWVLVALMVALVPLAMVEWETLLRVSGRQWLDHRETFIDLLYAGTLLLSFLLFHNVHFPFTKQISDLGAKSYGIYLTHALFIQYTAKLVYRFYPTYAGKPNGSSKFALVLIGLGAPTSVDVHREEITTARFLYISVWLKI